ncbi:hypothetical protein P152DRAFT_458208 [Eremomyces bilateralis CBS 781.70]|uniref:Pyridoxamine phosphate oxidase family protein n=1 Tax=Eremomyces bilateralis CBS 781.70 TaxID=1392243 RepID=A0A6G1G4W6_9PEZI|nr:uncharacterized protein P152DRAFT_458208 [Eremomyces bilateralis CBS 781.70]KAF1813042.1 hypothetical protein P152DRAFT_458208 [Eremomyces bilateralis CBS 781.70]
MVQFYPSLTPELTEWLLSQPLFYIASAPLTGDHVNLSPKGYPRSTLAVLSPNRVVYLDKTGSGIETISHIYENGRATIMACSFGKSPRIMRLFCRGRVIERGSPGPDGFDSWFTKAVKSGMQVDPDVPIGVSLTGVRALIILDVFKAQTSCGFAVPVLSSVAAEKPKPGNAQYLDGNMIARETLQLWNFKTEENALAKGIEPWGRRNEESLDGLPGLKRYVPLLQRTLIVSRSSTTRLAHQWRAIALGVLLTLSLLFGLRSLGLINVALNS